MVGCLCLPDKQDVSELCFYIVKIVILILCELVHSTSDQLVDHQQMPLYFISVL